MKILFNCLSLEKGGAERVISVLANKFIEKNYVTIVTLIKEKPKYDLNKNIKLISVDKSNYLKSNKIKKMLFKILPNRLIKLAKIIKTENPDIIISFLPEPSLRLMLLKKINKNIKKIPTIVSIRNNPEIEYKNRLIYYIMKMLYKNVDGLVLQTEEAKDYFKKIINEEKLTVIPNPINEKFIVNNPYIGEREKTIVTVGRLERQKNQKLLIDAFKNVVKKHDDYKLLIYGKGSLKEYLEEYVVSINLTDKVIFKGQVDNIQEEIFKSGIFVLSSDYEGMPNALMEAMSLGLPCISTDCPCGGPKTLMKNNKNGILVEVGNVSQMEEAMNLLIEDKEMSSNISYSANQIKDIYSINKISDRWINVIESLVNL